MKTLLIKLWRLAPCVLFLGLAACVTTTTGGFNAEVSEEQALQDYLALARGYLEQGNLVDAKRHLDNAAAIDESNAEVFAVRALVYAREGEMELADEHFRRSLRLDRDNSQARNNYAAFLYANDRFEEAYEQLEIVVRDTEYAARPQAFENLGLAAMRLNNLEDAERAFARAVQLNRNQLRSLLELSSINLVQGEVENADRYYRNYLTILQFYNLRQSARSLWIGIQLARAQDNETRMLAYGAQLSAEYENSPEFQLYRQLLDNRTND